MNDEIKDFLYALIGGLDRLPSATREQDKARQKCRKNGWVTFDRASWQWKITETGREAFASEIGTKHANA